MRRESEPKSALTVIRIDGVGLDKLTERYSRMFDAEATKRDRRERHARTKLNPEGPFFNV